VPGNGLPIVISRHYSKKRHYGKNLHYSTRDATARMYCANTSSVAGTTNQTEEWPNNEGDFYKPVIGACLLGSLVIWIIVLCGGV